MSVHSEYKGAYALLHDDEEEDLVGSDWHQRAIISLYNSLNDLAANTGQPWHVGNQLPLAAWKPNGDPWSPSPDIMIYPDAGPTKRDGMSARDDGLPALIVEVASPSTWRYDVDAVAGKAAGYLALDVPEYLVFDPTGRFLRPPCRAWRLVGGVARPWQPEPDGRYMSHALSIALSPDGDLLRVCDSQNRPIPYDYEKAQILATQAQELHARAQELHARAQELHARAQELHARAQELHARNWRTCALKPRRRPPLVMTKRLHPEYVGACSRPQSRIPWAA